MNAHDFDEDEIIEITIPGYRPEAVRPTSEAVIATSGNVVSVAFGAGQSRWLPRTTARISWTMAAIARTYRTFDRAYRAAFRIPSGV